jgi:hypothetical protein
MRVRPPAVEVAEDADALGGGGPYGKLGACDAVNGEGMGAELFVKAVVTAFVEEVKVVRRKKGSG